MDTDEFVETYMRELAKKAAGLGYKAEDVVPAVWSGTKAMQLNDGTVTNRERFWPIFNEKLGITEDIEPFFDDFYRNEFNRTKQMMKPSSAPRELLDVIRSRGFTLVLATNLLFPLTAVETRLGWIDATIGEFDYITTYENSGFCKPNLEYYRELLRVIGKVPTQCLMAGNSVQEDMCAAQLGMEVFLVNEFVENKTEEDYSALRQGGLTELAAFLKSL